MLSLQQVWCILPAQWRKYFMLSNRKDLDQYPESSEMHFVRTDPTINCLIEKSKTILNHGNLLNPPHSSFDRLQRTINAIFNNEWLSTIIRKFGCAMALIKLTRLLTKEICVCEDILFQRQFKKSMDNIESHFSSGIPKHPKPRKANVAVVNAFQRLKIDIEGKKKHKSKDKKKNRNPNPF